MNRDGSPRERRHLLEQVSPGRKGNGLAALHVDSPVAVADVYSSGIKARLGFRVAIVRFVALVVSIVSVVGILWTFFDPRRRGWHDIVAGTVVIAES